MMLGEANAELNDQDAAIAELERVIQDHPSSPVVTRAMWRVAKSYETKGDTETARKRYQAVLGRSGPSDELYVKSAAALEQLPAPPQ
jgi:TolA-binding protein